MNVWATLEGRALGFDHVHQAAPLVPVRSENNLWLSVDANEISRVFVSICGSVYVSNVFLVPSAGTRVSTWYHQL